MDFPRHKGSHLFMTSLKTIQQKATDYKNSTIISLYLSNQSGYCVYICFICNRTVFTQFGFMVVLQFSDWWKSFNVGMQSCWITATVSTLLLCILLIMSLFDIEDNQPIDYKTSYSFYLSPQTILSFIAAFSWTMLIIWDQFQQLIISLGIATLAGFAAAYLAIRVAKNIRTSTPLPEVSSGQNRYIASTGRVLHSIPSHRNGFGKVHLDIKGAPYELEAMTAGTTLKPGDAIKVVEIIDGRILVVEPLDNNGYPHEEHNINRR